jgi:hypothetical protein
MPGGGGLYSEVYGILLSNVSYTDTIQDNKHTVERFQKVPTSPWPSFLWLTLGFIAVVRYFPEGCILYARIYTMCTILEIYIRVNPAYLIDEYRYQSIPIDIY